MKLLVEEPQSSALVHAVEGEEPYVTSIVGIVEVVRACRRANVLPSRIDELRAQVSAVALDAPVRDAACALDPPLLRTLDAIHVATALSLGDDLGALVTYDERMADAARAAGLHVVSPA